MGATPPDTSAFVLFGWVSPPADSTTEARVAEMAAIGLNLILPAWQDEGCPNANLARLDWAAAHGMRCLIWDSRVTGAVNWLPSFEDTLDDVAAAYRDHPAFWGYYLGDEPPRSLWPLLSRLREALRARDPAHPAWNNLSGRVIHADREAFELDLRDYSEQFSPAALSTDHYDFRTFGDYGLFVENLAALREVADERRIPFWNIVQLVPHSNHRPLSHGELRWQVSESLAHGARGIGYFTYWTPDPDSTVNWQPAIIGNDGVRTPWYEFLRGFNPGVRRAGEALARARWRRTTHAGSVPRSGIVFAPGVVIAAVNGRAALGEFVGGAGEELLLVANSDSLAARLVTLDTRASPGARLVAGGSAPSLAVEPLVRGARMTVSLAAGDFALLELEPPIERASFTIVPNPAADRVRFALRAPAGGLRFDIVDPGGRRVWGTTLSAATGTIEWRGQQPRGSAAAPGVYFARLTGAGGTPLTRRFVWLGAR
ncbi:MAG: T9SS type A sorting domain-containing protein [Candidatus Eisenbacteria bacterium]